MILVAVQIEYLTTDVVESVKIKRILSSFFELLKYFLYECVQLLDFVVSDCKFGVCLLVRLVSGGCSDLELCFQLKRLECQS
jgi:hypothetical protein